MLFQAPIRIVNGTILARRGGRADHLAGLVRVAGEVLVVLAGAHPVVVARRESGDIASISIPPTLRDLGRRRI